MCQSPFHPDCQGCTCHHVRPPCDHCVEHRPRDDYDTINLGRYMRCGETVRITSCGSDSLSELTTREVITAEDVTELGIPHDKVTLLADQPDLCLVDQRVLANLRMQRNHNRVRMMRQHDRLVEEALRQGFIEDQFGKYEADADKIMRDYKPIYEVDRIGLTTQFSKAQNPFKWWTDDMMPPISADLPPGNYDVAPGGITRIKPSTSTPMKEFLDSLTDIELSIRRHVHDPDYKEPSNAISPASPPPPPPAHAAIAPTLHRAALSLTSSPSLRADLRAGAPYLPDDDTPPHPRHRRR